jgi:Na+(H+)/acetate symporter ActP
MRLLQSLGVAEASLLLLRFPFSFLSIGSNMVAPPVSVAVGVAAVVISIAMSTGASLLLSPASPVSRSLLSLPLASVFAPVRQTSLFRVVLVVACWLADALCHRVFCQDST